MAAYGTPRAVCIAFAQAPIWLSVYQLACPVCAATHHVELCAEHHAASEDCDNAWGMCTAPDHPPTTPRRFLHPLIYPEVVRAVAAWDSSGRHEPPPTAVGQWWPHVRTGTYIDDSESLIDVELDFTRFTDHDWQWLHVHWPGQSAAEVERLRCAYDTILDSPSASASTFPVRVGLSVVGVDAAVAQGRGDHSWNGHH